MKRSEIIYMVILTVSLIAGTVALDAFMGTGVFGKEPHKFACYENNYTIRELPSAPFYPECGNLSLVLLRNTNGSAFIIDYESDVNYSTYQMEDEVRYAYGCGNWSVYFYLSDERVFMIRLLECVRSYTVYDNKTVWCNGTVEACETLYNGRK